MMPTRAPSLADLPDGGHAVVTRLVAGVPGADAALLRRLAEIGFVEGEPVRVLRRGPGGREPLAVQVGETLFALRLIEARCVEVCADIDQAAHHV
jgi:ferrous iron transport protein A